MIVPPYIAALGSCDLSWGVNERIIANALIEADHYPKVDIAEAIRVLGRQFLPNNGRSGNYTQFVRTRPYHLLSGSGHPVE